MFPSTDTIFYDSLWPPEYVPHFEWRILTYPLTIPTEEIVEEIYTSDSDVIELYRDIYRKDSSVKYPLVQISDREYLVNTVDFPRHLITVLISLENSVCLRKPTDALPSFDTIRDLVGDFHMEDVKELVESDIYRKFEELVDGLCEDDKAVTFKNFLHCVALKNVHMTHPPGYEVRMRRFIERLTCRKKDRNRNIRHTAMLYAKANEIESGNFIRYNNCFYSMLEKPVNMSEHEYLFLSQTGTVMPLMREFLDGFFNSGEDEYEKYGVKFQKDCLIDVPLKHIGNYVFKINTDIGYPRYLYDSLLSLEYVLQCKYGLHIIVPVDEIREITEGLYVDNLEDLFESEAFRKLNKLTEGMEYYNEVCVFEFFLYMVTLNNIHLIANPKIKD